MAASKFTPEYRAAAIDCFGAGLTISDTCAAVGLNEQTLKRWLTRGRKEKSGVYADFAKACDGAKAEAADRAEPLTEYEHRVLVAEACRKGSVAALKLGWEMILDDRSPAETEEVADPLSSVDELAQRRAAS